MSILISSGSRIAVQGITGREAASCRAANVLAIGTRFTLLRPNKPRG